MTQQRQITKGADEMFCESCGQVIKKKAAICVHCGVPVGSESADTTGTAKKKHVAVLLAVFLALWTWVYTYEDDMWKFWVNLILSVVTVGLWGFVAWPWAIIDAAIKPESYYVNYGKRRTAK